VISRASHTTLALFAGLAIVAVSCGSSSSRSSSTSAPASPTAGASKTVAGSVTVFAASSLTAAFTEAGKAFSAANPGTSVTFNFAGSSALVTQIGQGAPADVFASADDANMKKLTDAGEATGAASKFARNSLEILVAKGNPKGVKTLSDLSNSALTVVLCAAAVPCGASAAATLTKAKVKLTPKSLEDQVKGVVTKVTSGEADAGIVFVTDVSAAGAAAEGVAIPDDVNTITNYPIVVTHEATNAAGGSAFISFIESGHGQAIMAKYGFLTPAA